MADDKERMFIDSSGGMIEKLGEGDSAVIFREDGTTISVLPLTNPDNVASEPQSIAVAVVCAMQNQELLDAIYENMHNMIGESFFNKLQKLQKTDKSKLN